MSLYIPYMKGMDKQELTLEELSERSGVEQRTLRSWVSEGLLSPPFKPGRGASYPASNADRALAIRALKDIYGLSLAEIGRRFLMASDEQISAWAMDVGQAPAPSNSARDYLKMIRSRAQAQSAAPNAALQSRPRTPVPRPRQLAASMAPPTATSGVFADGIDPDAERSRIEALIQALEGLLSAPAARRSQSAIWTRITITSDLELSVRGELSPSERHLFEQLADQLRAILTGRTKHD
jgi:DNA-binding transcriptional MerR regulator